jgi:hypothetical protein
LLLIWQLMYMAALVVNIRNFWRGASAWRFTLLFILITMADAALPLAPDGLELLIVQWKVLTVILFAWLARTQYKVARELRGRAPV